MCPARPSITVWKRVSSFIAVLPRIVVMCAAAAVHQAGAAEVADRCPELPGLLSDWQEQEAWVWHELCAGREVDLRKRYGGAAPPEDGSDWPEQRDLSQKFLGTILLRDPYRSSIPYQGVVIIGARFKEEINLANGDLPYNLSLIAPRFEHRLNMRGLKADRSLIIEGAHFVSSNAEVVALAGAKIGGNLSFEGIRTSGHVNMDSLAVAGNVAMRSGMFGSVWLANAKIGGELDISGTTVLRELRMIELDVGHDLKLMGSTLTNVLLVSANIGRNLSLLGPRIEDCRVRVKPWIRPAVASQSVDLTGATISGTLSFGHRCYGPINEANNWGEQATLSLRNASAHTLEDGILCLDVSQACSNTWPPKLELNGFTYQELGEYVDGAGDDMAARPARWWIEWLNRQSRYSPQPYEYLASALAKLGYKEKANDILYAGKDRELAGAGYPESVWLWLERAFIGYGYRPHYALFWVLGFVFLGVTFLRVSGEGPRNHMPYGFAYSFDMLLPIVRLRDFHYSIDLKGYVRYYFYFHKLMGYVLASFLIAGLSGLTK